jgi:hypothetical protein
MPRFKRNRRAFLVAAALLIAASIPHSAAMSRLFPAMPLVGGAVAPARAGGPPRRCLAHLLAGLAILPILAVATAAEAAMLKVCNKTSEKISNLSLEEAKLRSAELIANGSRVSWSDVVRGPYYIRYINRAGREAHGNS